jgi:3-oxoacyl-(acyl-carrier-protein) synthase
MANRVVITGIGIISALSDSVYEILNHIGEGKSAFMKMDGKDLDLSCQYTGCYNTFDAVPYLGKKGLRYLNRCTRMTLAAAGLALKDGNFTIEPENEEEVGVILATNLGVDGFIRDMERIVFTEGADFLSPLVSPFCSINAIAGQVSIRMKPKAFNITVPSGFTSGINSILMAKNLISSGKARVVMVGGAEELSLEVIKEYDQHNILAKSPEEMIPFSSKSGGILLGDGAVFILVEDLTHALARDANIYAEIESGFLAFSPEDSSKDRENSFRKNLESFLHKNKIKPEDINLIMSSANGSYMDQIEQNVFIQTFLDDTFLINLKTWFGEGFSFTNQLQAGLGAAAIRQNKLSGNFPLKQLKGEFVYQKNELKELQQEISTVLVNSCGLDGTYGSLLLKKYN